MLHLIKGVDISLGNGGSFGRKNLGHDVVIVVLMAGVMLEDREDVEMSTVDWAVMETAWKMVEAMMPLETTISLQTWVP